MTRAPAPRSTASIQNAAPMPNAPPTVPNMSGTSTSVNLLKLCLSPIASPLRPGGARLYVITIDNGPQQPRPTPSTKEIAASMYTLVTNGNSRQANAATVSDPQRTVSSLLRLTSALMTSRVSNTATAYVPMMSPITDADRS